MDFKAYQVFKDFPLQNLSISDKITDGKFYSIQQHMSNEIFLMLIYCKKVANYVPLKHTCKNNMDFVQIFLSAEKKDKII